MIGNYGALLKSSLWKDTADRRRIYFLFMRAKNRGSIIENKAERQLDKRTSN